MSKATKKVSTAVGEPFPGGVKDSFGPTLKKARRIRHLTLDELAEIVGCSASALSKIENRKATPSFSMLYQICQALRMDVTTLLQSRKASQALVTKAGRHPMYHTTGMEWTRLLPARAEHRVEASIVELAPGARSEEPMAHGPGDLLGFVLEGKLKLTVDGKPYHIDAGDSFAFSYDRPHSFANTSARKSRVMFILAPPVDFASRSQAGDGS